jgi:hypothetical protein
MTVETGKVESSAFGNDGKKTQWLKNVANLSAILIVPQTNHQKHAIMQELASGVVDWLHFLSSNNHKFS